MFILTTVIDKIRVPAHMLGIPTLTALHNEIDLKYPNRVLMNVGLVVCRYGKCLKITNGTCVQGDGGCHHECLFRLVVFRPFVEEVCLGTIVKSTPEGIQVRLGNFYHDIFIPAYWMLRPSKYSEKLGLWVWSPDYDGEGDEDEEEDGDNNDEDEGGLAVALAVADAANDGDDANVKMEEAAATSPERNNVVKKEGEKEDGAEGNDDNSNINNNDDDDGEKEVVDEKGDHFEMEIGAEIRFKIKSIHFTQVTNTAKGVQATTTTTAHSQEIPTSSGKNANENTDGEAVSPETRSLRKRSLSVEVSDMSNLPASMNIVASICEDGLGLTSWWASGVDSDEDEDGDNDAEEEVEDMQVDEEA